jgi:hypothetical protein
MILPGWPGSRHCGVIQAHPIIQEAGTTLHASFKNEIRNFGINPGHNNYSPVKRRYFLSRENVVCEKAPGMKMVELSVHAHTPAPSHMAGERHKIGQTIR